MMAKIITSVVVMFLSIYTENMYSTELKQEISVDSYLKAIKESQVIEKDRTLQIFNDKEVDYIVFEGNFLHSKNINKELNANLKGKTEETQRSKEPSRAPGFVVHRELGHNLEIDVIQDHVHIDRVYDNQLGKTPKTNNAPKFIESISM